MAVWTRDSGILGPQSVVWERGGWEPHNFNDSVGKGWGSLVFHWEPRGCFAWQPVPPGKEPHGLRGAWVLPSQSLPPESEKPENRKLPLPRHFSPHSLDSMGQEEVSCSPAAPSSPATGSFSYPFYRWKSEIKSLAQGCQLESRSDPTPS